MDSTAIPERAYRYRDLGRLTSWLRIALLVLVAAGVVNLLAGAASLFGYAAPKAVAGLLAIPSLLVPLAAALVFFIWIYRAAANIHALGADVTFTPGWAVGWFLIPVLDLWMSFLVVEELWRASVDAPAWRRHIAPWPVVWWWAVLAGGAILAVLLRLIAGASAASVVAAVAEIATAYLFVGLSAQICKMQDTQAARTAVA
ncbi:MAG TPA: DUF4328 domain-containing protein [Rhizomicrobium sp.]